MEIEIECDLPDEINKDFLIANLPKTKTKILDAKCINDIIQLKLFTSCNSIDEIKQWVSDFQQLSNTSYSITVTKSVSGRYVAFKQFLHCRHNTRSKNVYDSSRHKNSTRNTDCPSTVKITLHAKKKRYQSKDKARNELFQEMRCEIELILTHNHKLSTALSFRKVSDDVKEKLINLYSKGHSPATALQTIKMDIYMNFKNHKQVLADRMHCPDYNYCYNIYINQFKKIYGPLTFDSPGKEFLKKRLEEYNEEMKDNCAQLILRDSDYIICICPPLSKRVHQLCRSSSEMVFMDSSGTRDHDSSRIFVLLTHSEAGGLPLGVIITSSDSANIIQIGFQLLKDMLGNTIFGGNPEGPKIFLTDDLDTEHAAINAVWTNSKCLLRTFHVLQSIWEWLIKAKNNIPKEQQNIYFQNFKTILYSRTVDDCDQNYEMAKSNVVHVDYLKYLDEYWQKKELWALCYRNSLLKRGIDRNNISEAAMRIITDNIFNHIKAFNVMQLVDFILTNFVQYYELRLLHAANNCQQEPSLIKSTIKLPPAALLKRISILSDNIVIVPSESTKNLVYIVNFDALTCSCCAGNTGKMCKHIHWAAIVIPSANYNLDIDTQKKLYHIATGTNPPNDLLLPSTDSSIQTFPSDNIEIIQHTETENENDAELLKNTKESAARLGKEFSSICEQFIEKYPNDAEPALKKMLVNMKNIQTISAFTSACSRFGSDYNRRTRQSSIPVQPTAIRRRKTLLSGRKNNIKHKLSQVIDNKCH